MSPVRASLMDDNSLPQDRPRPVRSAPAARSASLARVEHSPSPTLCPIFDRANSTTRSLSGVVSGETSPMAARMSATFTALPSRLDRAPLTILLARSLRDGDASPRRVDGRPEELRGPRGKAPSATDSAPTRQHRADSPLLTEARRASVVSQK